jgi:hypothetical protein
VSRCRYFPAIASRCSAGPVRLHESWHWCARPARPAHPVLDLGDFAASGVSPFLEALGFPAQRCSASSGGDCLYIALTSPAARFTVGAGADQRRPAGDGETREAQTRQDRECGAVRGARDSAAGKNERSVSGSGERCGGAPCAVRGVRDSAAGKNERSVSAGSGARGSRGVWRVACAAGRAGRGARGARVAGRVARGRFGRRAAERLARVKSYLAGISQRSSPILASCCFLKAQTRQDRVLSLRIVGKRRFVERVCLAMWTACPSLGTRAHHPRTGPAEWASRSRCGKLSAHLQAGWP